MSDYKNAASAGFLIIYENFTLNIYEKMSTYGRHQKNIFRQMYYTFINEVFLKY